MLETTRGEYYAWRNAANRTRNRNRLKPGLQYEEARL